MKMRYVVGGLCCWWASACQSPPTDSIETSTLPVSQAVYIPVLKTNSAEVDSPAFALNVAMGDLVSNLRPWKNEQDSTERICLFAGMDYYGPWSRDGAINIQNGAALIVPLAARNTLLTQFVHDTKGRLVFGGEYWDNLLLTRAHWDYYLQTGDTSLLSQALEASLNTLADRERDEFDSRYGLFRGASGFNDGISAYPDLYARTGTYQEGGHWLSNIKKWPEVPENASVKASKGFGLPMMALSTNCVYYSAYTTLPLIARKVGREVNPAWETQAQSLRRAINTRLWDARRGAYLHYVDPNGDDPHQEGMGYAYALTYGVATDSIARTILRQAYRTPQGLPCLWPGYKRYEAFGSGHYPRHAQTIWPMNQGLWAQGAALYGDTAALVREWAPMWRRAVRDMQFYELYHPFSGQAYGGVQEDNQGKLVVWKSGARQTWAATAYWRIVWMGLLGLKLDDQHFSFQPCLPHRSEPWTLRGLRLRSATFDIRVQGAGTRLAYWTLDGVKQSAPAAYPVSGHHQVVLMME